MCGRGSGGVCEVDGARNIWGVGRPCRGKLVVGQVWGCRNFETTKKAFCFLKNLSFWGECGWNRANFAISARRSGEN